MITTIRTTSNLTTTITKEKENNEVTTNIITTHSSNPSTTNSSKTTEKRTEVKTTTKQTKSSNNTTTTRTTTTKQQCESKKFIFSWVRADFETFDECVKVGDKYSNSYGYYCDDYEDLCGKQYYMLTLFDSNGNLFDYHNVQMP